MYSTLNEIMNHIVSAHEVNKKICPSFFVLHGAPPVVMLPISFEMQSASSN